MEGILILLDVVYKIVVIIGVYSWMVKNEK